MSNISGIGGFILFPQKPLAAAQSGSGTAAPQTTLAAIGGAFEITLSQQTNADGSDSDDVSFEGYINKPGSGSTTVFGAEGKGDSAQSAFEAMMASFEGLGVPGTGSGSGSGAASGDPLQNFSSLLANLFDPSAASSGSGTAAAASSVNSSGSGSASPDNASENPMQLISSMLTSLETVFDNTLASANNAGNGSTT